MSDERQSDAPLHDSAADVLTRVTDAVFALDDEWRFTYLNEQAERLLQRDESDLLGRSVWDELPDEVQSTFERNYRRAMETQQSVTFEESYPPLSTRFEVQVYPSETGLSVSLRDVTERVDRQDELHKRERALRNAYEIIADFDKSFSQQIEELLTVVRETVGTDYATLSRVHNSAGTYIFETVDVPDGVDLEAGDSAPLAELPNCATVVETEQTLVLRDVEAEAPELADPTWGISCYLGAPVSVDGEVYGTFCFYGMDARVEEFADWEVTFVEFLSNWVSYELERQRQHDRLESFASMLAHELRNPLNIAQIYVQQAAMGDETAAEEVASALDRIEELIDVILVTARGTDSVIDWEAVEIADVAGEAWTDEVVDRAELVLETDQTIRSDPIHLQHLLENLFKNAVKHGSTSDRPTVDNTVERGSANNSRQADTAVRFGGPGVTVRVGDLPTGFYVADDGCGIPPGERTEVFQAGYTSDESGMGLGLTFVKQLADTYGWECRITESDAGGARFEFTGVECTDEE